MRDRRCSTRLAAAALVSAAIAAGCGGSEDEPDTPTTPSEAPAPSTAAPPEGPGGDRIGPVGDGQGGVELAKLGDFEQPLYVAQPRGGDDGHLYVVEQCGRIHRVPVQGGEAELFLDVGELISCGGEQGLLSVAFAPDYADSALLYVYYTDTEGDERIVEYRRSDTAPPTADPESARELLRIDDFASNHNGGLLLFGPGGRLYAGTGDGGGSGDPERTAQDPESPLGKLLRVDTDDGDTEIAALGLRNPWRFSFDRETGDLWLGDVGQNELEEIDSATRAEISAERPELNFGWSAFEGTQPFNDDQSAPGARPPTLEYPIDGGCSVTGGYVVRDRELESLYGRYLYGDFCAGELRSFIAEPGRAARDDLALGLQVPSLSSFGEDTAGRIYATSLEGPVYRLEPEGSD
ncbi:MAG: PQQ-dependent sugar dehydrogenase [Solirubrobacterales bacterium]